MSTAAFYRELAPPPGLGRAVRCLWMRSVDEDEPPVRVLPDACVDLIWQQGRGAILAGPDTRPHLAHSPPGTIIAGVRFRPGTGGAALASPLEAFRDQRIPVDELGLHVVAALEPDLTPSEALHRLTDVAARMVGRSRPDPAVEAAASALGRPGARFAPLARDIGLSERQLRRRCIAAVGYGPTMLRRVLRLQRFLARLSAPSDGTAEPDLAELAFDAGYADQPHLTRECASLAGLTPSALAATWSPQPAPATDPRPSATAPQAT